MRKLVMALLPLVVVLGPFGGDQLFAADSRAFQGANCRAKKFRQKNGKNGIHVKHSSLPWRFQENEE
jgi:hypothetical protein